MMNILRTLIVDDEQPARKRIRSMLSKRSDIQVLAECGDGQEALSCIDRLQPDLVFLDIQMPELNGFDVIQHLGSADTPSIVFVSAYSEHAVKAFEVNALDYLLKPFNTERLNAAVDRVQTRLRSKASSTDAEPRQFAESDRCEMQSNIDPDDQKDFDPMKHGDRIALKYAGRLHLVKVTDIVWIEAARNYVRVHANGRQYLLRQSMKGLEKKLDSSIFMRVHRSVIINIGCVESLEPTFHGDYRIFLNEGSTLPLSRKYKSAMQERFGDQI